MIMETYKKKYKDAQKWIESIYTELTHERQMEAEAFFPELKERKRGDTREDLISFLEYLLKIVNDTILGKWTKTDCVKWIDWVKKQDPTWFEEELEKAYKCADEVQYRNRYEDAKREILGMVDIESITESYKQKLLSQCHSVNRPVFRISVEAFKHGAKTILDELYLKQCQVKESTISQHETETCKKLTETKGREI